MTTPALSVVVSLISGRVRDLENCLSALDRQGTALDVIVPYDEPSAHVTSLRARFPSARFILAEGLDSWKARSGASREHHDTLRTIGLQAATTGIVAMIEDHARADESWARALLAEIDANPRAGAVGGPVDCRSARTINWAVWFCDFSRYQSPMPEGPAAFVSDSNVAYRRSSLRTIEAAWRDDYHEPVVHDALRRAGFELRAAPGALVWQMRTGLTLAGAVRERFVWARSYAGTRSTLIGRTRRFLLAALSPLLPLVMTWRVLRTTLTRGRHRAQLAKCLPGILGLHAVWALGELVGYITGRPY